MFAHEIGHLLGFSHDFESGNFNNNRNKCPSSGEYAALVMSYGWVSKSINMMEITDLSISDEENNLIENR